MVAGSAEETKEVAERAAAWAEGATEAAADAERAVAARAEEAMEAAAAAERAVAAAAMAARLVVKRVTEIAPRAEAVATRRRVARVQTDVAELPPQMTLPAGVKAGATADTRRKTTTHQHPTDARSSVGV